MSVRGANRGPDLPQILYFHLIKKYKGEEMVGPYYKRQAYNNPLVTLVKTYVYTLDPETKNYILKP